LPAGKKRQNGSKSASKAKKSGKSPKKNNGSGNKAGSSRSKSPLSVKSESFVPEPDQIPEESVEISEEVNEILDDLEPAAENSDNHPESEEISSKSAGIQEESEQIFFKTKSRDNNKNFCACVTPAKQGVFFIKNNNIKNPPSGVFPFADKAASGVIPDQDSPVIQPDSPKTGIHPDSHPPIQLNPPTEQQHRSRTCGKSYVYEPEKPEDWIPFSERPFPGSRIEEAHHERTEDSCEKSSAVVPKNNKYANRPFPYWNSRICDAENAASCKAVSEIPKTEKFSDCLADSDIASAEFSGILSSPTEIPKHAGAFNAGAFQNFTLPDLKAGQQSASTENRAAPDKSNPPTAGKKESKSSIASRKKTAKRFLFGAQPMPVQKREGVPDAAIDDFNKICKELAEMSATEKINIQAGKSENKRKARFNPYAFVEQSLNRNRHPEAILESIQWLVTSWGKFDDPWAYGQKILVRQSQNYYEFAERQKHDERMKAIDQHFHPEIYGKKSDLSALGNGLESCTMGGNA